MKTRNVLLVALATTVMTSCNKGDESHEVSPYFTIDAGMRTLTRATTTTFEANDQVSILVWTGSNTEVQTPLVVDNSVNTYDGTHWTASPQMLWKDAITPHFFIGVHPAKAVTNFTADAYATTPDLLVATLLGSGQKPTEADGVVSMMFDHVMARLDVNLTFRNQFDGIPTVKSVTVSAQPGAKVNYLTKTATGNGTANTAIALAPTIANKAYSGIIAPQTGVTKVTIMIGDKEYAYIHNGDINLQGGRYTTMNLIVGRDKIELGSVSINDWGSGDTIDDGEAEEQP